jgi:hypothetical protein
MADVRVLCVSAANAIEEYNLEKHKHIVNKFLGWDEVLFAGPQEYHVDL